MLYIFTSSAFNHCLYCAMQGDLGYLYLDLKSRKDKHPICAHFAIKGGRRISDTDYQLPVCKDCFFFFFFYLFNVLSHVYDITASSNI